MKKKFLFLLILHLIIFGKSFSQDGDSQYMPYAPDGIPFVVSDTLWRADGYGNHRAIVSFNSLENTNAVYVKLPWRRPDMRPETKKIIVINSETGNEIKNISITEFSSESGTVVFEPDAASAVYYIYYMPYRYRKGWNDARYGEPWNDYLPPVYEADKGWLSSLPKNIETLPKAGLIRFESRSRFDFFTPMGCIATQKEMDSLRNEHVGNPIIFTEDRAFPIRLTNQIPAHWTKNVISESFSGRAMRNEYYVWQIGLWAAHQEVKNVRLIFSDFTNNSDRISKKEVTCFNQEGVNWDGNPLTFTVNVPKDKVQALWCGIQIPENAKPGFYKGVVTLTADGISPRSIPVQIEVVEEILADKGDGDLWRHARLRWLNSRIGEDNLPVYPYKPMTIDGNTITATDKKITIAKNGLPSSIKINNKQVLEKPLKFLIETDKEIIEFNATNTSLHKKADGLIKWTSSSSQKNILFNCSAYMEYDGYIRFNIQLSANTPITVKNIKLISVYTPYASEYFMGTGFEGGSRPVSHSWDWEGPWDSYWMGNDKAGLHVEFRGSGYNGPLLNDYKPAPPQTWSNNGHGSISVTGSKGKRATVIAQTGMDTISSEIKDFEFALLITPVKPVNTAKHFSERYYHSKPAGFDKAAEEGANIANIHHAQNLNPVINYPFIVRDSLIDFIAHQHQFNRKVKIYYTIRELSNYTTEIFALKSLNHEIFPGGRGYGVPWLCEQLIDDYKPAWYTELPNETSDAALVLNGFSRWINYYLEGLRWMFENYKLDGIYMDDVSFDRNVMKRMRKIIQEYRPGALVDLHSNTWYSVGPANQYTDFFPYIDRLWFGESFKYNQMTPDEWFVTFSGIPFGQMSEMLQDGGNRFLGMVYGTTARHSYSKYSPAPVWSLWKSFSIEDARMLGYWDEDCPVKTSSDNVKATAYVKPGKVLISIGNFGDDDTEVKLKFDWKLLRMNPSKCSLSAPDVEDFQKGGNFNLNDSFSVKSKEGLLLILSEN